MNNPMSDTPFSPNAATVESPTPVVSTPLLFLVSIASLFLELMLIRWIGTEVRLFTYVQNAVLVVCFLGLGMGCWTCRRPVALREIVLPLGLLVLLLAVSVTFTEMGKFLHLLGVYFWSSLKSWEELLNLSPVRSVALMAPEAVLAFLILMLIWDQFVPLGRLLGCLLHD